MERLTIVRKPTSQGFVNEFEVLETGETFSSLTGDIAVAFADYVKVQEYENYISSWMENQSQEVNPNLDINIPSIEEHIPENKPELSARQDTLEKLLIHSFAEHLVKEIRCMAVENCNGCEIDHPSQRQHDCMMMDNKTLTSWYLTEALERVNKEDEAMKTFQANTIEHSLNGLELLRYQCKDSRNEIFCRRKEELELKVIEVFDTFYL